MKTIIDCLSSIIRNKFMSLASILTIAVSMYIFGLFALIITNINSITNELNAQAGISVYLKSDLDSTKINDLTKRFELISGITDIKFISKETALNDFIKNSTNKRMIDSLDELNPLPDSFQISVSRPSVIPDVVKIIEGYDEVENIKYGENVIQDLFKITSTIHSLGIIILIILFITTIVLIMNTIRIAIFSKKEEIKIMKLVGATDNIIQPPFIIEGGIIGFLGVCISIILIKITYFIFVKNISDNFMLLRSINGDSFLNSIIICMLICGILVGCLGSFISVKKFL